MSALYRTLFNLRTDLYIYRNYIGGAVGGLYLLNYLNKRRSANPGLYRQLARERATMRKMRLIK